MATNTSYSLVADQYCPSAALHERDQGARLGDLGRLIYEHCVEVHVPQHSEAGARAGREDDPSLLDSLDRLLHQSGVVRNAPPNAGVDRELLQGLVDFRAISRGPDDLLLVEQLMGAVVSDESLEHVVHGY